MNPAAARSASRAPRVAASMSPGPKPDHVVQSSSVATSLASSRARA